MSVCYLDTSAVIKRYLSEPNSAEFDAFVLQADFDFIMSPLVITEITSALARRVRNKEIKANFAASTKQLFQDDLLTGDWALMEFQPATFTDASSLISTLTAPLSTLDALHLACALNSQANALATADKQLATAARKAGLQVFTFF